MRAHAISGCARTPVRLEPLLKGRWQGAKAHLKLARDTRVELHVPRRDAVDMRAARGHVGTDGGVAQVVPFRHAMCLRHDCAVLVELQRRQACEVGCQ
eukprot:580437-Prymnesium_polylepis.2